MMNPRTLAHDTACWYQSHLDPRVPHSENVKTYLGGIVEALTIKVLQSPPQEEQQQQQTKEPEWFSTNDWRSYLASSQLNGIASLRDKKSTGLLSRRDRARLEAFLDGCALAVPNDIHSSEGKDELSAPRELSLNEGLSGFLANSGSGGLSTQTMLRPISSTTGSSTVVRYYQFETNDLTTRLELYLRTLKRAQSAGIPCVVALEPSRAIKARIRGIIESFVITVGCVRKLGPTLMGLLSALTKELLAVETLGNSIVKGLQRMVSEYEHRTSFASLAFLSTPEESAENHLSPLIDSYMKYMKANWEQLVGECELERMLVTVLDEKMRTVFKTIEFKSIGHLLETCHILQDELQSIELPPNVGGMKSEDIDVLCSDSKAIKQAIRDLQREVFTVNGHPLPPVQSRKELVQLMSQTLNSRSIFRSTRRRIVGGSKSSKSSQEPSVNVSAAPGVPLDSDGFISSGNEGDTDGSSPQKGSVSGEGKQKKKFRKRSFHLSTVDHLTRRLLLASSRTGLGGDAYFVVRDLFGGDDVEVFPSKMNSKYGNVPNSPTIEIVARLASVTIKCYGSFDVYPKSMVGEVEPLIQLHTTTTETIGLQEVRASDSEEGRGKRESDSEESSKGYKLVLQEKKTAKTGWRTLSIRPAQYERVEVYNTPS